MLVGLLAWYDEEPWYLHECVESVAELVDHLVAVDGSYASWPEPEPRSRVEQAAAVGYAARDIGLTLFRPRSPWVGDEVEKRAYMFELARTVTDRGWLLVIDGDERVAGWSPALRSELATTPYDVATVQFRTLRDLVYEEPARRLFRLLPRLTVWGRHNTYVADGRRLWGDPREGELAPALDATGLLALEHRSGIRERGRDEARHAYVAARPEG